jgi:mannose-6-phosphate isomerase-like protein (cupin superfamily)
VRKNDFMYFPPGVKHGIAGACRLIVMGFKIPPGDDITSPPRPPIANIDEVQKQVVGNHPPSTLYQLLMGDRKSTRDKIAAGLVLTSLFIMEFASGGTNTPHHHAREEEIYLVLNGHGEMVAGEGRYAAKAGDAYFFPPNCTVGFYSGNRPGEEKAHILAVRSLFPFRRDGQKIFDVPGRIR